MSPPRVVLVELEGLLAEQLTQRLASLGVDAASTDAVGVVQRLVAQPPELAIVNVELSRGSGFSLVNRVLRMEALAGLRIALVAEEATEDALDAHRLGGTPAAAYVRRVDKAVSSAAFAEQILEAVRHLLELPEADNGDVVEVERAASAGYVEPLAETIAALGYRVLRRLRDEDSGAVFACMDDELHRAVAIKLMAPHGAGDDRERLLRFQRERRILALLHSPYVIAVYGAGTHGDTPYLVRELIDGESLTEQIEREGPLDVTLALRRVRETALGLKHAATAGVIHRDVRPENIHVVDGHAKLARFGMGRREAPDEARITQAGLQLKDMTYVAPERVRGQEDARGDIYALGVTLHTLIAGRPPFTKPVPINVLTGELLERPIALDEARPGTPANIAALVSRLTAEKPEKRPQDYDEVLALIDEATRVLNGTATPQSAELVEPTAVHGTLRLMSVVEIVQSLELARKTAVVSLPSADEPEGKLAFEAGRLVHASFGAQRGEDAFFTLVDRQRGVFRVDYEAFALERNIEMTTTGLLLEAARRADVAANGTPETAVPTGTFEAEPEFFEFTNEGHAAAAVEKDVAPPREPRQVSTPVGFAVLAACTALAVYGGFQLPAALPAESNDDPAMRAMAELLADTRDELEEARIDLATLESRLAPFEAARASVESAGETARRRAGEVQANIEAALKPELSAGSFTLRLSDDGAEAVLDIGELALFAGDGDEVVAGGKTTLARIAGAIAPLGDVHVRVEGHTDDAEPRGRHRNNWGLSGARSMAVAKVLTEQGLVPARVKAIALADTMPVISNRGPKGRARNRRVELHLAPQADPPAAPAP